MVGGEIGGGFEVFGQGLPCDGHAGPVDEAFSQQEFEQGGRAADVVEVGHDVFARGFEIREERDAVANGLEVVDC